MIRVLKNADFSNCGLGKIHIPLPETNEANVAVGWFNGLTPEQETKLKTFIDTLVFSGIYKKLTYLAIPYLASTPSEAIQNVLLEKGAQQPSADGNLSLETGNGLTFTGVGQLQLQGYRKGTLEVGEFSMGTCIVYPNSTTGKRVLCRHPSLSSAPRFDYMSGNTVNALVYSNIYTNNVQGGYNEAKNKNIQILSCSTSLGEQGGLALNGINNIVTLDATNVASNSSFLVIGGTISVAFDGHYRLIFEGAPLEKLEIASLRDEIATLCNY